MLNDIDSEIWLRDKILLYLPSSRRNSSSDINFRCPFCHDSQKSKTKMRGHYYLKSNSYYCFNCDTSCSGLYLLAKLSGIAFDELKREYIQYKFKNQNRSIKRKDEPAKLEFHSVIPVEWKKDLSIEAHQYLSKRKVLSAPFLYEQLYTIIDKNSNQYILIPWIVNGIESYYQLNDFTGVFKGERKYIYPYQHNRLLYGLDNIDVSYRYIFCFEGVYDSVFVKNGIAIGGKVLTELQKQIISKRYPYHKLVLSLDNDLPGKTAAMKYIDKEPNIKLLDWSKNFRQYKDVNETILGENRTDIFSSEDYLNSLIISSAEFKLRNLFNHDKTK